MDTKNINNPNPNKYPVTTRLDPLNKNYVSDNHFKIDKTINQNIFSIFSTGDQNAINEKLVSNEILNFRVESGETLVHAIIKNTDTSLTESIKQHIIETLVHKNVSLNAMNEFNQYPIHLAAKHGYYNIFNYLISKKCDYNQVDNYGNAPIHYLIDKFVDTCKNGELYDKTNKDVKMNGNKKNLPDDKIIDKILLKETIRTINSERTGVPIDTTTTGTGASKTTSRRMRGRSSPSFIKYLFENLNYMVKSYKLYAYDAISKIIKSKQLEITNLHTNYANANIKDDIKKILNATIGEISTLYKGFTNIDVKALSESSLDTVENTLGNNLSSENITKKISEINGIKELGKTEFNYFKENISIYTRAIYVFYYNKKIFESKLNSQVKLIVNGIQAGQFVNITDAMEAAIIENFKDSIDQTNLIAPIAAGAAPPAVLPATLTAVTQGLTKLSADLQRIPAPAPVPVPIPALQALQALLAAAPLAAIQAALATPAALAALGLQSTLPALQVLQPILLSINGVLLDLNSRGKEVDIVLQNLKSTLKEVLTSVLNLLKEELPALFAVISLPAAPTTFIGLEGALVAGAAGPQLPLTLDALQTALTALLTGKIISKSSQVATSKLMYTTKAARTAVNIYIDPIVVAVVAIPAAVPAAVKLQTILVPVQINALIKLFSSYFAALPSNFDNQPPNNINNIDKEEFENAFVLAQSVEQLDNIIRKYFTNTAIGTTMTDFDQLNQPINTCYYDSAERFNRKNPSDIEKEKEQKQEKKEQTPTGQKGGNTDQNLIQTNQLNQLNQLNRLNRNKRVVIIGGAENDEIPVSKQKKNDIPIQLTIDSDNSDNSDNTANIEIKMFENQEKLEEYANPTEGTHISKYININWIQHELGVTFQYKFNGIFTILKYIEDYFSNIKYVFDSDDDILNLPLYYVCYNNEILINIMYNLQHLKTQSDVLNENAEEIIMDIKSMSKIIETIKDTNNLFKEDEYLYLQSIIKQIYQKAKINKKEELDKTDDIFNIITRYKDEYLGKISSFYKSVRSIIVTNFQLTNEINDYMANIFLNNFIQFLKMTDFNTGNISISNFVYNNFPSFNTIYDDKDEDSIPISFTGFNNKYRDLTKLKENFLTYYYSTNFNILYNPTATTFNYDKIIFNTESDYFVYPSEQPVEDPSKKDGDYIVVNNNPDNKIKLTNYSFSNTAFRLDQFKNLIVLDTQGNRIKINELGYPSLHPYNQADQSKYKYRQIIDSNIGKRKKTNSGENYIVQDEYGNNILINSKTFEPKTFISNNKLIELVDKEGKVIKKKDDMVLVDSNGNRIIVNSKNLTNKKEYSNETPFFESSNYLCEPVTKDGYSVIVNNQFHLEVNNNGQHVVMLKDIPVIDYEDQDIPLIIKSGPHIVYGDQTYIVDVYGKKLDPNIDPDKYLIQNDQKNKITIVDTNRDVAFGNRIKEFDKDGVYAAITTGIKDQLITYNGIVCANTLKQQEDGNFIAIYANGTPISEDGKPDDNKDKKNKKEEKNNIIIANRLATIDGQSNIVVNGLGEPIKDSTKQNIQITAGGNKINFFEDNTLKNTSWKVQTANNTDIKDSRGNPIEISKYIVKSNGLLYDESDRLIRFTLPIPPRPDVPKIPQIPPVLGAPGNVPLLAAAQTILEQELLNSVEIYLQYFNKINDIQPPIPHNINWGNIFALLPNPLAAGNLVAPVAVAPPAFTLQQRKDDWEVRWTAMWTNSWTAIWGCSCLAKRINKYTRINW